MSGLLRPAATCCLSAARCSAGQPLPRAGSRSLWEAAPIVLPGPTSGVIRLLSTGYLHVWWLTARVWFSRCTPPQGLASCGGSRLGVGRLAVLRSAAATSGELRRLVLLLVLLRPAVPLQLVLDCRRRAEVPEQ